MKYLLNFSVNWFNIKAYICISTHFMLRSMILREIQQHVTGFNWYGAGPVCLKHHRYEYDELKQKFSLRFYFDFASFKSLFNIKLEDLSVLFDGRATCE